DQKCPNRLKEGLRRRANETSVASEDERGEQGNGAEGDDDRDRVLAHGAARGPSLAAGLMRHDLPMVTHLPTQGHRASARIAETMAAIVVDGIGDGGDLP